MGRLEPGGGVSFEFSKRRFSSIKFCIAYWSQYQFPVMHGILSIMSHPEMKFVCQVSKGPHHAEFFRFSIIKHTP